LDTLLKILIAVALLVTGVLLYSFVQTSPPATPTPVDGSSDVADRYIGDWHGFVEANGGKFMVVFHISQTADGALTATWDSVDQDQFDLPVESIEANGASITLHMPAVNSRYEGELSADGTMIDGTWYQGDRGQLPLQVHSGEIPTLATRPQDPVPPFPYQFEEISFPNTDGGHELAGTLTLPEGDGPFPAAILISGSGPQDRNSEFADHRPFWVLADHLTRQGIAVLRYDDRGIADSTGDFNSATSADFAIDALSAIKYLQSRSEIDAMQIGLIGHSEGGIIAAIAASQNTDIAYVVLMASPGVSGKRVILSQNLALGEAGDIPSDVVELSNRVNEEIYDVIIAEQDDEIAAESILEIVDALNEDEVQKLGFNRQAFVNVLPGLTSPWFRYYLAFDPGPTFEQLQMPVLALNGLNDLQIIPEINLVAIETALSEGGNPDFEIGEFEDLNHLFQTSETGLPGEYEAIDETLAPVVLEKITAWILEKTASER